MKRFHADIEIDASPDAVWAVLIDTAAWPIFDPYSERIDGQIGLGETITAFSKLAPGHAFPLEITTFDRSQAMAWTGGMPLGMLKNVRTHTIIPSSSGCRFEMTEIISGPLLGVIAGSLPDLTEPFAAFCSGLKARVEAQQDMS